MTTHRIIRTQQQTLHNSSKHYQTHNNGYKTNNYKDYKVLDNEQIEYTPIYMQNTQHTGKTHSIQAKHTAYRQNT